MRGFLKGNIMANLAQELAKKAEYALATKIKDNTSATPPEILQANKKGHQDAKDKIADIFNVLVLQSETGGRQYSLDVAASSSDKTFTFYEAGYVGTLMGLLESQGFNAYSRWSTNVDDASKYDCKLIVTW
jgi:hypothetical protein